MCVPPQTGVIGSLESLSELWLDGNLLNTLPDVRYCTGGGGGGGAGEKGGVGKGGRRREGKRWGRGMEGVRMRHKRSGRGEGRRRGEWER